MQCLPEEFLKLVPSNFLVHTMDYYTSFTDYVCNPVKDLSFPADCHFFHEYHKRVTNLSRHLFPSSVNLANRSLQNHLML